MSTKEWKNRAAAELQRAETARGQGNEGMARVCARRAAGIAVGEYLARRGLHVRSASAYEQLKFLITLPDLDPEIRAVSEHLLLRVTPEHTLPVEADLIAEARWLISHLLGEDVTGE